MQTILAVRHATKRFGPVVALNDVSLTCHAGEVHAIMGANGAGKSTLVKVVSGVHQPDAGELLIAGEAVRLDSPSHAAKLGIATVFQELSLFPSRTVAENLFAGHEPRRFGLVDARALYKASRAVLDKLGVTHLDPSALVGSLSLADRQLVEIGKALAHDPRVLILDEGTSALARPEVVKLFELLRRLKAQGLAIVFISHRMPEIQEVADRLTVFRDGRDVATGRIDEIDERQVVDLMLGHKLASTLEPAVKREPPGGAARVTIQGLTVPGKLAGVDLEIRHREILGLAGLAGQGQDELLLALFGAYRRHEGTIAVDGQRVALRSPWAAKRAGFGLIPAERKTAGALLPLSIRDNIALPNLAKLAKNGFTQPARERARAEALSKRLAIKSASTESAVASLSGGNQQKVVIAKWIEADTQIFLLNDPTRGIDIGAKTAIYDLVRELSDAGRTVIFYSTEIPELIALCDRVAVMDRGRIVTTLEGDAITESNILRASVGLQRQGEAA